MKSIKENNFSPKKTGMENLIWLNRSAKNLPDFDFDIKIIDSFAELEI